MIYSTLDKTLGGLMIRGLILYYLNIKPTHGYEIQRFIQLMGLDQWAKIQSGSIYYALTKLEKEKNIQVLKEERTGSRVRKIYEITSQGRNILKSEMRIELATPIMEIGSLKYIVYPMINTLDESEMRVILQKHIRDLQEKQKYWEIWKSAKCEKEVNRLSELSFEIAIHSLADQISWHEELLLNLRDYVQMGEGMKNVISKFEPECIEPQEKNQDWKEKYDFIEKIKETVEQDPKQAIDQLNKYMEEMMNQGFI